jgi:hypothetical protein
VKHDATAYSALERPLGENRDCSVRALAIAAGMTYEAAHQLFKDAGRVDGKTTAHAVSCAVYERLGFPVQRTFYPGGRCITLAQLINCHPKGRFIVHRKGHAFALIDGVVHDWARGTGARSRVRIAWQVT